MKCSYFDINKVRLVNIKGNMVAKRLAQSKKALGSILNVFFFLLMSLWSCDELVTCPEPHPAFTL